MWNRVDLKIRAKERLKSNYGKCLLAVVIANLIIVLASNILLINFSTAQISIPDNITRAHIEKAYTIIRENWKWIVALSALTIGSMTFVTAFVVNPLSVGQCRFFNENAKQKTNLKNIFFSFTDGHKSYFNIVKTEFIKSLFLVLWAGVCMVAVVIATFVLYKVWINIMIGRSVYVLYLLSIVFGVLLSVISIVCFIPLLIKMYQYYMIDYILADEPEIAWHEAFKKSKQMMKGEKIKTLVLTLSFAGWIFVGSVFLFGIGTYLIAPYINATNSELYFKLKAKLKSDENSEIL